MAETVATLETIFTGVTTGFDEALSHVKTSLNGATAGIGSQISGFGDKVTKAGQSLLPYAAAITGVMYAGINTASGFESIMAELSARTGTYGEDLAALSDFALQMGADTMFSANDAASALLELTAAGLSAGEAMAVLPSVLDLAAAGGISLADSAAAVTGIMAQFQLDISDAAMVTDVLAQASAASRAEVIDLAQAFGNVGPVAAQFGLDVEETAAALAVMANNGLMGAEAGTALKSMLINMTRDTDDVTAAWDALGTSFYDAEGNARPLNDVLEDISTGLEGMPVEEQNRILTDLAGTYGIVALQALLSAGGIDEMQDSMHQQTSAAEVAATRMDTFAGSMDALGGSVETLQIRAFTPFMQNTLRPLVVDLTNAINKVAEWAAVNPELSNTILSVAAAFVGLTAGLLVIGKTISVVGAAFSTLQMLLGPVATGVWAIAGAIGALVGVSAGWILLAAGFVVALVLIATNAFGARDAIFGFIESVTGFSIPQAWEDFKDLLGSILEAIGKILGVGPTGHTVDTNVDTSGDPGAGMPPAPEGMHYEWGGKGGQQPIFVPDMDSGGMGQAGQPYLIGKGAQPELFVPDSAGSFYPAGSYGGGGGQVIQFGDVHIYGVQDGRALWEQLQAEARRRNVTLGVAQ